MNERKVRFLEVDVHLLVPEEELDELVARHLSPYAQCERGDRLARLVAEALVVLTRWGYRVMVEGFPEDTLPEDLSGSDEAD